MAVFFIMNPIEIKDFRETSRQRIKENPASNIEIGSLDLLVAQVALFEAKVMSFDDIVPETSSLNVFTSYLGSRTPVACMPSFSVTATKGYTTINSNLHNFTVFEVTKDRRSESERKFGSISCGLGMHGPLNFWLYENGGYTHVNHDGTAEEGSNLQPDQVRESIRIMTIAITEQTVLPEAFI